MKKNGIAGTLLDIFMGETILKENCKKSIMEKLWKYLYKVGFLSRFLALTETPSVFFFLFNTEFRFVQWNVENPIIEMEF